MAERYVPKYRGPNLTPTDVFVWRQLKGHVYTVPSRIIEYLVARLQAAVTRTDVNLLRCIRENVICRTAVSLQMDGGRLDHLSNYESPMVYSFDSLHHLTVTCILTPERHRTMPYNISNLFNMESRYGAPMGEFNFTQYMNEW
jgi:hypothetical protein